MLSTYTGGWSTCQRGTESPTSLCSQPALHVLTGGWGRILSFSFLLLSHAQLKREENGDKRWISWPCLLMCLHLLLASLPSALTFPLSTGHHWSYIEHLCESTSPHKRCLFMDGTHWRTPSFPLWLPFEESLSGFEKFSEVTFTELHLFLRFLVHLLIYKGKEDNLQRRANLPIKKEDSLIAFFKRIEDTNRLQILHSNWLICFENPYNARTQKDVPQK